MSPLVALAFELGFRADVERLKNPCIDGCNDIHGTVQIGFVNAGFPCVRKAAFYSRLTIAHHSDGKSHKDLFAFTQIINGVSIAVKLTEISSLHHKLPLLRHLLKGIGIDRASRIMFYRIRERLGCITAPQWMVPHSLARCGLNVLLQNVCRHLGAAMRGAIIRYGFTECDRRPPNHPSSLGLKFIDQTFERLE